MIGANDAQMFVPGGWQPPPHADEDEIFAILRPQTYRIAFISRC
jgi:hypothetical protein